jgi:hypothetical protein
MTKIIDTKHNQKTLEEFVAVIRENVEASIRNWHKIAAAFAEAKEMFGASSDSFKALCKATKFSLSKASKLASIASSERLKEHEAELSAVHSWTVLYEITTLTDEQFERLLKKANEKTFFTDAAPFISIEMVMSVKRSKTEKSHLCTYATIKIDFQALQAQLITGDHLATLEEHLRQIETSLPYIQIVRTEVDHTVEGLFVNKLHVAKETAERKAFAALLERQLKKYPKKKNETTKARSLRVLGMDRDEAWSMFREDRKVAFDHFGCEYDQADFWNKAQEVLSKQIDKLAQTVQKSRDAFEYANNVSSDAGSDSPLAPVHVMRRKYSAEHFADFK